MQHANSDQPISSYLKVLIRLAYRDQLFYRCALAEIEQLIPVHYTDQDGMLNLKEKQEVDKKFIQIDNIF